MFTVNNEDARRRSCVFIVNFEHISSFSSGVSIGNFENVIADWDYGKARLFYGEFDMSVVNSRIDNFKKFRECCWYKTSKSAAEMNKSL